MSDDVKRYVAKLISIVGEREEFAGHTVEEVYKATDYAALQQQLFLAQDQLQHDQDELREANQLLNEMHVDSNGEGGYGKRQTLTLPQRICVLQQQLEQARDELREWREKWDAHDHHPKGYVTSQIKRAEHAEAELVAVQDEIRGWQDAYKVEQDRSLSLLARVRELEQANMEAIDMNAGVCRKRDELKDQLAAAGAHVPSEYISVDKEGNKNGKS